MSAEQETDEERPRVEHSAEVEERWRRFKHIYNDKRVVIENRWISMTKQKMRSLLSKTWRNSGGSGMPQEHRPDLTDTVPWRSATDKNRKCFPFRNASENHLRWPQFNLEDLTNRKEPFLWMLKKRASDHPREFAILDTFRENTTAASFQGLLGPESPQFKPGMAVVKMSSASEDGDEYGILYYPEDDEEFSGLLEVSTWHEHLAILAMVNQRRIYHFLEEFVADIMAEGNESLYKCDNEHVESNWGPEPPPPFENIKHPQYDVQLEKFLSSYSDLVPYHAISDTVWEDILCIVIGRTRIYAGQLRNLKSHPGMFYDYIRDMREVSHHDVLYWPNNESHSWAGYDDNMNNSDMFGTYLMKALYTLTEGFDSWHYISRIIIGIKSQVAAQKDHNSNVWYLLHYLFNRLRLDDLRTMIACSSPLRKYFRVMSETEAGPDLRSGLAGTPAIPENDYKVASLVSLLRAMKEPEMDELTFGPNTWPNEILNIIRGTRGTWMSNIVVQKAEESLDAGNAYLLARNAWDNADLSLVFCENDDPVDAPLVAGEYLAPSQNLRKIDPKGEIITNLVSKHMIPYPDLKFNYPSTAVKLKAGKRRENATIRRQSEENLKALWEDLQPMLEAEGALSERVIDILNSAVPSSTAENGDDVTPDELPAPPQSDPPAEPQTPPPPTGTPGSAGPNTPTGPGVTTTTPTRPLGGLSIKSPANRPPPVRTPERKTANDGVKKYSPIRRARPDEDRPRRPMVDRARRRADLQRIVPAAPALPAAPDPGRERPKIELPSAQYDLLRQLMSTDNEKRPGQVAWKDMISLFEAIGFRLDKGGRKSRGALEVFVPTQDLAQSQGISINKPMSKDRPHRPHLDFTKARAFVRGAHGLGKYDWDFSHFKEAGT